MTFEQTTPEAAKTELSPAQAAAFKIVDPSQHDGPNAPANSDERVHVRVDNTIDAQETGVVYARDDRGVITHSMIHIPLPLNAKQAERLNIAFGKVFPEGFVGPDADGYVLRLDGEYTKLPQDKLDAAMKEAGLHTSLLDAFAHTTRKAPHQNQRHLDFTRFTVTRDDLVMTGAEIGESIRSLLPVRVNETEGSSLPKRNTYLGRTEKGDVEIILPGKRATFPLEEMQSGLEQIKSQEIKR